MLFLSNPQIQAIAKLTHKVDMSSITLENSPTGANVIRATLWDNRSNVKQLDIHADGCAKIIPTPQTR